MRRLLLSVVLAATAAFAVASSAWGIAGVVNVKDDEFDPAVVSGSAVNATTFVWQWDPSNHHDHSVVQNDRLFSSGEPAESDTLERTLSAGKYPYHCEVHGDEGMKGKVKIRPEASVVSLKDNSFRVFWAVAESQTGDEFDVRFRVNGGNWRTWKENTGKRRAFFGKNDNPVHVGLNKTYEFQARSQKSESKRSGWSPKLTVDFD